MASQTSDSKLDRYSKENRWYYKSLGNKIPPQSHKLLQEYSKIPPEEVDEHIYRLRDILWSHAPYPCIGEFKFLTLNLPSHPLYPQVLQKLQPSTPTPDGPFLLDLGCCVAQELRSLAYAGIPSTQLFGSDINPHFLTTSYDLFCDRDTFKGTLVAADIFSPTIFSTSSPFGGWEGKFSITHAGLFLHLFSWEQQLAVCKTIIKLLKVQEGSLLVGEMVGCAGGGERGEGMESKFWKKGEERKQFLHDEASLEKLWGEVAEQTGTVGKWKVQGKLRLRENGAGDPTGGCAFFTGEGIGWLTFSVERLSQ